eukprot:s953_g4.t1
MPAPTTAGGWSTLPLKPSEAATWLREVLGENWMLVDGQAVGTHSAKATVLSWMCKAHAPGDLQRLAGYHVDPNTKSSLEYSRDAQAPVLHFIEGMLLVIFSGLFIPDCTRAGRWSGCRSIEQALDLLAKRNADGRDEEDQRHEQGWQDVEEDEFGHDKGLELFKLDSIPVPDNQEQVPDQCQHSSGEESNDWEAQSSASERISEDDHEGDDDNLEYNGSAVAGIVHRAGRDVRVFKHKISGIFHLMAEGLDVPDEDGELSNTKCGKLISHNFMEVAAEVSFLPAKCKRCFAQ